MGHQDAPTETRSFLLAHGDKPLSLSALEWSDGSPSPRTKYWLTDTNEFSQRASSKSPSLYSAPSTCSTQDFPPTPPPISSLRLPQVPAVPTIRHRTPQACDKCRERKTKVSFFAKFAIYDDMYLSNYSARGIVPLAFAVAVADSPVDIPRVRHEYAAL